jgi:ferritin-like metal-binding protein YciE
MVEKILNDLFLAQLKDIYYAEKKIYRTLPKMVRAAQVPELKQAFTAHREETQGHIERLEQVFEMIGKRPQAKPCEAINGIVAEGRKRSRISAKALRSIPVWLQLAKRSNIMRWRATAHSLRGRVSSTCRKPRPC